MNFEKINTENKFEYWDKIDEEFGFSAELISNYFKKIGEEKKAEDIIQEWLQELADWRADNGASPVQNLEKDIVDLKEILTIKAESNLLSEEATADSCYYDHLLLLSLGNSEIQKDPKLQYKKKQDVDQDDILDVAVNDGLRDAFYREALEYLSNSKKYNKNKSKERYNLEKWNRDLDADALIVLNKFSALDSFYSNRDYYNFKTLPAFVADEMIKNKQQQDLYYHGIFSKFESLSDLVAKDVFNNGSYDVVNKFLNHFERFSETDPLWALDKVLKCDHSVQEKSLLDFINNHIKDPVEIKKAYELVLRFGIKITDEKINHSLSENDQQEYRDIRDKFVSEISSVLGDDHASYNHREIKDLEKFYEMAGNGYAPALLSRISNYNPYFDGDRIIEQLKKNGQSCYILGRYDLKNLISSDDLIDNIINEGDMDVLASRLNNLSDISEENIIKLWDNAYDGAIKKNVKRFSNLSDNILQLFIDSGEEYIIFSHLDSFNISQEALKGLIDDFGDRIVDYDINLKYFEDRSLLNYFLEKVKDADSFKKLLNKCFLSLSLDGKNKFAEAISKTEAFKYFLTYTLENSLGKNYLSDLDLKIPANDFDDVIEENLDTKVIILFIESIKNKPNDSFYVQNIEQFTSLENRDLISYFIELVKNKILSRSQEDLALLFSADENLAKKLIKEGAIDSLSINLEKFKSLDEDVALALIDKKETHSLVNNLDKFDNLSRETGQKLISSLEDFSEIVKVNDYYKPPLDRMIAKTSDIFGANASPESYNIIKKVDEGDRVVIKELKLKNGGNDGLRELQERFTKFKEELIREDFNPDILLEKENEFLYLPYFQSYVRYQEAQWGRGNKESLQKTIDNYKNLKNKGELKTLNPNFRPSEELYIAKSNAGSRESHEFNEHFLNRFSVLVESIKSSQKLYQEKFPITKLVEEIEEKRLSLVEELKEKSEKMPNPRAKEGISNKIKDLESLNIRSIEDFQNNFSSLAKNKEFNELLRQAVFLISFAKNKESLEFNLDDVDLNKPKLDDMSWVLNFVDHITNQETMSKYFTDKKSARMFSEVISAQAISEEMALLQNKGGQSKDNTKIQLVPTRGILSEFSGQIADACWASKYDSILKKFPNFSSVVIRQNPETKHERLAGAFMLIETQSKDDEPLLVIRGFNPIENLINSLSVEDFYSQVTDYVKGLAEKDKRKVAIVIDDHSGGAATNRPVLFQHLSKLSKTLEAVDLKSEDDTSFNSYNIVRKTYLV